MSQGPLSETIVPLLDAAGIPLGDAERVVALLLDALRGEEFFLGALLAEGGLTRDELRRNIAERAHLLGEFRYRLGCAAVGRKLKEEDFGEPESPSLSDFPSFYGALLEGTLEPINL